MGGGFCNEGTNMYWRPAGYVSESDCLNDNPPGINRGAFDPNVGCVHEFLMWYVRCRVKYYSDFWKGVCNCYAVGSYPQLTSIRSNTSASCAPYE